MARRPSFTAFGPIGRMGLIGLMVGVMLLAMTACTAQQVQQDTAAVTQTLAAVQAEQAAIRQDIAMVKAIVAATTQPVAPAPAATQSATPVGAPATLGASGSASDAASTAVAELDKISAVNDKITTALNQITPAVNQLNTQIQASQTREDKTLGLANLLYESMYTDNVVWCNKQIPGKKFNDDESAVINDLTMNWQVHLVNFHQSPGVIGVDDRGKTTAVFNFDVEFSEDPPV